MASTSDDSWAGRRRQMENGPYRSGPNGRRGRWRHRPFKLLIALFGASLRLTPLYARGRRNALDLKLVDLEIAIPGLPAAFDGYRIAHVSDTHLDELPELAEAARRLLDGVEVDLLALTGDIHGHVRAPLARSTGFLAHALGSLVVRDRRVAVLGNHDPAAMVGLLQDIGFEVLVNRSMVLERGGERLRLTGLDDVHFFYTERVHDALHDHAGEVRIALVHSAEVADHAANAGYALYLCGHTHGGQICLPGGRPVVTQLTRCRHAGKGLWRQGSMTGYTTSGLGVSGPPLRFNCRGEVALITLRKAPPQ